MLAARMMLAICLLSASASAAGAEWWRVAAGGTGADETIMFVDQSTIRSNGSTYLAWSYFIYEKLDTNGVRKTRSLKNITALIAPQFCFRLQLSEIAIRYCERIMFRLTVRKFRMWPQKR